MKRGLAIVFIAAGAAAVLAAQILFALHKPYPAPPRFSADPLLAVSLPLFIGGLLMALVGLLYVPLPVLRPGEAPPDAGRTSWLHKTAVVIVLLLAFALRAYRITEMPPPLFDDEANLALDAMKYLNGEFPPGTMTGWFETPLAFTAVNSLALRFFGPTVVGARAIGVVFGTLTVLALYGAARSMMGPSAGLLAMLSLTVERWHITLSRSTTAHITLPFVVVLAFLFAVRAFDLVLAAAPTLRFTLRRARVAGAEGGRNDAGVDERVPWHQRPLWSVVASAACLGASMYTYLVSRLLAVGMALFLLYLVIHAYALYRRQRDLGPLLIRRIGAVLLYGVVYLLVFTPLALHYYRHADLFTNRYKSISLPQEMRIGTPSINWQPLLTNLASYPLMLNYAGDEVPRYGPPFRPILNVVCATLFALGMVLLLRHWWRPANMFCLLWLWMPLFGGVLTWSETPSPLRTVAASTAVALITVIPIYYAMLALSRQPEWQRSTMRFGFFAIAAGLLLLSGAIDLYTYWAVQRWEPTLPRYCNYTEYDAARRVRAIPEEHPVYLRPHLYTFSSVRLLNWGRKNFHLFVPSDDIPLLQSQDSDTYLFLDLGSTELFKEIRLFHPTATLTEYPLAEVPGFGHSEIIIQGRELAESRGLWLSTAGGARQRTRTLEAPAQSPAELQEVTWEAVLDAPEVGAYQFAVRSTRPLAERCALVVADRAVASANQTINLLAGRNPLRLSVHAMNPDERLDLLWRRPGAGWAVIPPDHMYALPSAGSYGLYGTYYQNVTLSGEPFTRRIDLTLAASEDIPSPHSVRWTGFLNIPQDGTYTFHIRADDGARLFLDGVQVIDKWEAGGTVNGIADLSLTQGPHPIEIDYFDQGGGRIFEFTWDPPGGKSGIVPFELLSHAQPEVNIVPFRQDGASGLMRAAPQPPHG